MYPSNDPIVGPMVYNNDNPIIVSPNFNKPFFPQKIFSAKVIKSTPM
jgi:hypothetical protein